MVHSLADLLGSTVLKKEGSSRHERDSLTHPTLPGVHSKYLQHSNSHQRGEPGCVSRRIDRSANTLESSARQQLLVIVISEGLNQPKQCSTR